jgi:aminoglycoside 6-adenylyltransferase
MNRLTYEILTQRLQQWGMAQAEVRAVFIVGSRARADRPADEWSDMDVVLIVEDAQPFITSADWLDAFGPLWLSFLEPTATGDGVERRALFEGALDVDFIPLPAAPLREMLAQGPLPETVQNVMRRGYRFLVDKDGFERQIVLEPEPETVRHLPGEDEYLQVVNEFLYHCVWSAKKLRRGELWTALGSQNSYMMWRCLLPMLEWHASAVYQGQREIWFNGRFLEQWAAPRAVAGLAEVFAHYDTGDAWRALQAMMAFFRRLALDVAQASGLHYPVEADKKISAWIRETIPADMALP